jgi:hypothetical protein
MMDFIHELYMDFIDKLNGKHGVHEGPLGWDGDIMLAITYCNKMYGYGLSTFELCQS